MWEKIEVYPHRRVDKQVKERTISPKKVSINKVLNFGNLALYFVGFFIGRAILLGELVPFAAAFVGASSRVLGGSGFGAALAVMIGLFTVKEDVPLAASTLTVALVWLAARTLLRGSKKEWLIVPGLVFVVTVVVKATFVAFGSPSLYNYITVIFEAIFAGVLAFVFLTALRPFADTKKIRPLNGEEVFCLLVVLAGIIAGCNALHYSVLTLDGIITKGVILLAALVGGGGFGAAAGAVAGVIPALGGQANPLLLGVYSFSGLLAGVFRNFGKVGVVAGFILGNIILSLYLTSYGELANILAETGVAVLFILMIPRRALDRIKVFLKTQIPGEQRTLIRDMRFKEVVKARFREWSRMFSELSRTFEQVSTTAQRSREEKGLQDLFNEVTNRVCDGCALYRTCWEREFYKTYQDVLDLFSMVEAYGKVDVDDVPENLRRRCGRVKEICVTVECLYDNYKINQYWSDRFGESRDIVSEQLKGVAKIMDGLSEEIELDLGKDRGLDKKIKEELAKQKIAVVDLYTVSKDGDKYEVNVSMLPCGGKMECQGKIAPAISEFTGQEFAVAGHCGHRKGEEFCSFRLYPSLTYRVSTGIAKIGKHGSNISGDSYSFRQLDDGNFAVILSDGMGAGPRAALESSTTVSLLEHLLESGFGHTLSIKTVNSILTLRSFDDESFSTIDLAIINLYTGQVSFSKIGASPSYLIRGNKIKTVFAESLPAGVIDDIEVGSLVRVLKEGDMLVMVSDGALDSCMSKDKEEDFIHILRQTMNLDRSLLLNPQDFASCLLKEAYRDYGGHKLVKDDITIIATLLEKNTR